MNKTYDCLFLHPNPHAMGRPSILVMPMGLMALASKISENGYNTKIVHLGLEELIDPSFEIESILRKYNPKIVAIDLHWYDCTYDALRIAQLSKETLNCFIVLGGFTASFFDIEILEQCSYIDAIIRGEAEKPLLDLVEKICRDSDYSDVQNSTVREGSSIKRNPIGYVADVEDLDVLNYTDVQLVEHGYDYLKIIGSSIPQIQSNPALNDGVNWSFLRRGWLSVGRGCAFNCSYCGGCGEANKIISGREHPVFRSIDRIIQDITQWSDYGVNHLYIDYDPKPNESFYFELFKKIREEGIDIAVEFASWGLPNNDFVKEFSKTFDPTLSILTVSPESGSEKVRSINRSYQYSNKDLLTRLKIIEKSGIMAHIYLSVGLTGEREEDFEETLKLTDKIMTDYNNIVDVECYPAEIEPGAPRYLHPEKYGIQLFKKTFHDFYESSRKKSMGIQLEHPLGFRTNNLSEEKILSLYNRFWDLKSKFFESMFTS